MWSLLFIAVLSALIAPTQQQNQPPTWTKHDLKKEVQDDGIREDTEVGELIGTLSCSDNDSSVIRYRATGTQYLYIKNMLSGEVLLKTKLDKELEKENLAKNKDNYRVVFTCTDVDERGRERANPPQVAWEITIRDVNDRAPTFSSATGFTFRVSEGEQPGYVLDGMLTVTDDDDLIENAAVGTVELDCLTPAGLPGRGLRGCDLFALDTVPVQDKQGVYNVSIRLQAPLDYEKERSYNLRAIAVDSGFEVQNTGSIGLQIRVLDFQDTPPGFVNPVFNFEVVEGLSVGTLVQFRLSAEDKDAGSRRDLTFDILEKINEPNFFVTGAVSTIGNGVFTAEIKVKSEIDRENLPGTSNAYKFIAKATELDSSGNLTTATATSEFSVTIRDINDNAPTFAKTIYNVIVPENTLTIPITDLVVNDPDYLENSTYRVEVDSQSFPGTFDFLPSEVVQGRQDFYMVGRTRSNLDYDTPQYRSQVIRLRAVEVGTIVPLTGSATVSVTLTDVNDNRPVFDRRLYLASVVETKPVSSIILTLTATDADSGVNGQIVYSMSDRFKDTFEVDSNTGAIKLIKELNYEANRSYSFVAFATDNGVNQRQSAQVNVQIRVTDYNEEGPVFTSDNYTTQVFEGQLDFLEPVRLEAIDPDPTARITYRIVSGNTPTNSFVLDSVTGQLTLREPLSFGQTPDASGYFTLLVEATDNGQPPEPSRTYVYIFVLDQNDNAPIFDPTTYSATISEIYEKDKSLLRVYATDADYGSNGKITYRIGKGARGNFELTENGDVKTSHLPNFDYDDYQRMDVEILAIDGGSPQRTGTATMFITITDANNKKPSFVYRSYHKVLDEAQAKGTSVVQVSATDPDLDHALQYSIRQDTIRTVNKAGSEVESDSYNVKQLFDINVETGLITVSPFGPGLDRNFASNIEFEVQVEDVKSQTDKQTNIAYVFIIITGLPETELYFDQPWRKDQPEYRLSMLESTTLGQKIKTLQARDPADQGGLVVRTYREVPGTDPGNYFRLSSNPPGELLLNRKLDFESGPPTLSVVIIAIKEAFGTFAARTATATVIVNVLDANDNYPEFTRRFYSFSVSESEKVDSEVGTLTAIDIDSPSFGPIEFIIGVGQDRNDFKLFTTSETPNSATVQLQVAKKLDYERRSFYKLRLIARDNKNEVGGSFKRSTEVDVTIQLIDENDNRPTFTDRSRAFSVPETADILTRLGRVVARDDDFGPNGNIRYSLEYDFNAPSSPVDPMSLFTITESSGVLVTASVLRGLSGSYHLRVMATDGGNPPESDSIPVTIKVQGVEDDDGTPRWVLPDVFVVAVTEHNKTKLDIQIKAVPRTPNADIIYSLGTFGNDQQNFRIDSDTGDIFVTKDLDWEVQPTYRLLLEATDTLNPDKLSLRELTVNLIDLDDNEPSFEKTRYTACPNDFEVPTVYTVPDDTPAYTIIGHAVACDPDGPGNNEMYYRRYSGSDFCQRNLDAALDVMLNGSVQSVIPLDYEQRKEYLVCVRVYAGLGPTGKRRKRDYDVRQMNETDKVAYIVVKVTDLNDNRPVFPDREVLGVMETFPSEVTVIQVLAYDPDGPLNNRVIYAIKSIMYYPQSGSQPFSMRGAFTINPDTGEVTASLPSYQDFAYGYFQLEIEAFDIKNRMFNDTVIVRLVVYQRSQIVRAVLDQTPDQGQRLARELMEDLNEEGKDDGRTFFLIKASEHRTGSNIVPTQTDICFVIVESQKPYDASTSLRVLDSAAYRAVLRDYKMVDKGTCYPLRSTEDKVKWRDLWWVLVAIAVFIFICCIILIITIAILYDRYKNYMQTQRTYLVPQ